MLHKLVFVVGTGRCGTSTVARILHESKLACMGHEFDYPDRLNPQGYWEDKEVRIFLHQLLCGDVETFKRKLTEVHKQHGCNAKVIGYKHPIMAAVEHEVWERLNPYRVYWCQRPIADTVASVVRYRQFKGKVAGQDIAAGFIQDRVEQLEENLEGLPFVRKIDFSEYRTDEWILSMLRR